MHMEQKFINYFLNKSYIRKGTAYYPPKGVTRVIIWAVRLVAKESQTVMAANCCPGLWKH